MNCNNSSSDDWTMSDSERDPRDEQTSDEHALHPGGEMDSGYTTNDLRSVADEALRKSREDAERKASNSTDELTDPDTRQQLEAADDADRLNDRSLNRRIFDDKSILRIEVPDANPLRVEIRKDLIIGRSDNITDYTPDLDFSPYGAYRLGLSRRHAIIRCAVNRLELMDLGSRNGTSINGEKLSPKETRVLQDGDIVHFGNLRVQFIFERKPR